MATTKFNVYVFVREQKMRSKLILLGIAKLLIKKRMRAVTVRHKNHLQQIIKKLYLLYVLKKKILPHPLLHYSIFV